MVCCIPWQSLSLAGVWCGVQDGIPGSDHQDCINTYGFILWANGSCYFVHGWHLFLPIELHDGCCCKSFLYRYVQKVIYASHEIFTELPGYLLGFQPDLFGIYFLYHYRTSGRDERHLSLHEGCEAICLDVPDHQHCLSF